MERSWNAMDSLVNTVITTATAEKRQITMPLLKTLLEKIIL
jgi:hypothetical protein